MRRKPMADLSGCYAFEYEDEGSWLVWSPKDAFCAPGFSSREELEIWLAAQGYGLGWLTSGNGKVSTFSITALK